MLCTILMLALWTGDSRGAPGLDPEIRHDCITITRDETCLLRTEQSVCRSRRINVRVENVCERELTLLIIKGITGPLAIWADKIPASRGGRPSVRYYSCDEQYDKCRGIAIALRPLERPQARSIQLTEDERRRLRRLLFADEFLAGLIKAAAGLDFYLEFVGPGARGPTMFEWDKSVIKAWREVNQDREILNQQVTCRELASLAQTSLSARGMFQSIAEARGCAIDSN